MIDISMRLYKIGVMVQRPGEATASAVDAPGKAYGGGKAAWDMDAAVRYVKEISRTLPTGSTVGIVMGIVDGSKE